MSGSDKRYLKVSEQDIQSVSEKLQSFAEQLPQGEQNVVAWLLGRAADAPPEQVDFLNPASDDVTGHALMYQASRVQLYNSLGISQFARVNPGSVAAGSSVGVTGTIMF